MVELDSEMWTEPGGRRWEVYAPDGDVLAEGRGRFRWLAWFGLWRALRRIRRSGGEVK